MPEKKDESVIRNLEGKLHSRVKRSFHRDRRRLKPDTHSVTGAWKHEAPPKEEIAKQVERVRERKERSPFKILLIASIVFFVFSSVASALLFWGGSNVVSARNIDIDITGPIAVAGGQELVLQLEIVNRNSIPLELADLIVEYPDGTRTPGNLSAPLPRTRESLGTVDSGGRVKKTARAVLFGEENAPKKVLVTLEYRIENSNAIFVKEAEHEVILSTAPLSVSVDALNEIVSGQEVVFSVDITSNSSQVIEDALLVAEYPQGFELLSANPSPDFASNIWQLGSMAPQTRKTITLRGVVIGQNEEERVIRFSTGVESADNERELAATFSTNEVEFVIKRPFIGLDVAINGDSSTGDVFVPGGESVRVDIAWHNTLPTKVLDGEIVVSLAGNAYDRRSINANEGFYNSNTETIRWTGETVAALGELAPNERGAVGFTVRTKGIADDARDRNPSFSIEALVRGRRVNESNVPEEIQSVVVREIRSLSDLLLTTRTLYSSGAFSNAGPVPPEVETSTTYTVVWSVSNSVNDADDVRVVAQLPSYVTWLGNVSPLSERVSYNPIGGRITWDLGSVPARTGTTNAPREVMFQVAITPSLSQLDTSPVIVGQQTIQGLDRYTNTTLQSSASAITTELLTDPAYGKGSGKVVE